MWGLNTEWPLIGWQSITLFKQFIQPLCAFWCVVSIPSLPDPGSPPGLCWETRADWINLQLNSFYKTILESWLTGGWGGSMSDCLVQSLLALFCSVVPLSDSYQHLIRAGKQPCHWEPLKMHGGKTIQPHSWSGDFYWLDLCLNVSQLQNRL